MFTFKMEFDRIKVKTNGGVCYLEKKHHSRILYEKIEKAPATKICEICLKDQNNSKSFDCCLTSIFQPYHGENHPMFLI